MVTTKKRIRRGNEPIPALVAWIQKYPSPNANGPFYKRAFPLTTKELKSLQPKRQLELF
jgi:hypothetical protein